jgi:hypothetical protein
LLSTATVCPHNSLIKTPASAATALETATSDADTMSDDVIARKRRRVISAKPP